MLKYCKIICDFTELLNQSTTLTDQDLWRALILYGKNQSTYKMALGKILLDYSQGNNDQINLNDLAEDFFNVYATRMKSGKSQGAMIGRKTFVEQEIIEVNNTGKPKYKAIEVIK